MRLRAIDKKQPRAAALVQPPKLLYRAPSRDVRVVVFKWRGVALAEIPVFKADFTDMLLALFCELRAAYMLLKAEIGWRTAAKLPKPDKRGFIARLCKRAGPLVAANLRVQRENNMRVPKPPAFLGPAAGKQRLPCRSADRDWGIRALKPSAACRERVDVRRFYGIYPRRANTVVSLLVVYEK